ncbi:hypothetical protein BE221DRAFT_70469, partial [Ostreococcus tauri]
HRSRATRASTSRARGGHVTSTPTKNHQWASARHANENPSSGEHATRQRKPIIGRARAGEKTIIG